MPSCFDNNADRWDHERDSRKHDTPAHRFDKPLTTAMDIVLLVRRLDNLQEAANLVEHYADLKAAGQRLDAVAAGARP